MTSPLAPRDPDDSRAPYEQVLHGLRAAILTKKIAPGGKLPSQSELTNHYGFARATVQRALRVLEDQDLIYSIQGSGSFVREESGVAEGFQPCIQAAFSRANVLIDFAGPSTEVLRKALREPFEGVRSGRFTPENILIRILVPESTLFDVEESLRGIVTFVDNLKTLGLIRDGGAQVRVHDGTQFFMLGIVNKEDVFFGYHPVQPDESTGSGLVLFHHPRNDRQFSRDPQRERYDHLWFDQANTWFDDAWNKLGRSCDPRKW
jgi:DNA-binding transcriptional regulator YhcF (GntR family)